MRDIYTYDTRKSVQLNRSVAGILTTEKEELNYYRPTWQDPNEPLKIKNSQAGVYLGSEAIRILPKFESNNPLTIPDMLVMDPAKVSGYDLPPEMDDAPHVDASTATYQLKPPTPFTRASDYTTITEKHLTPAENTLNPSFHQFTPQKLTVRMK